MRGNVACAVGNRGNWSCDVNGFSHSQAGRTLGGAGRCSGTSCLTAALESMDVFGGLVMVESGFLGPMCWLLLESRYVGAGVSDFDAIGALSCVDEDEE